MSLKILSDSANFAELDDAWPLAHAWAIDQMPSPAYCCATNGAILHCNAAAVRIWGGRIGMEGTWGGFVSLHDSDNRVVDSNTCPCAVAASGQFPAPREFLASTNDGTRRMIVMHAKPVLDINGRVVGVFCCLTDISEKHCLQKKARHAENNRAQFLHMLAHELRNPLAPIMSVAGILKSTRFDPSIAKMASVLERQTRQLARFIADLLDASRVNCAMELPIRMRTCTKREVLHLALDAVSFQIDSRRQCLDIDAADREAVLYCDPERVAQALSHVLLNASAFTPNGQTLYLRAMVDGPRLLLEVVDCGAGMAVDSLQDIFEPFERGAVPPGRAATGAGLGLTIAKGVCDAHGGTIDVRSAGPGAGTTVTITLPVLHGTS